MDVKTLETDSTTGTVITQEGVPALWVEWMLR